MQKIICDCCGKELQMGEMFGGLMRLKKTYLMGMAQGLQTQTQTGIDKEAWDLCQDCQTQVWTFVLDIKEHGNKK